MTDAELYGLILFFSVLLVLAIIGWALTLMTWRSRLRILADLVDQLKAKFEEVDLTDCPRNCPHNEVPCCHWCPLNGCLLELEEIPPEELQKSARLLVEEVMS